METPPSPEEISAAFAREQLIATITTAFDGVERGDGATLHEGEELDCRGSPEELLTARNLDTDTRWQDVPADWLAEFSAAYWFLDAKSFRYYLPAVMIWSLKEPKPEDSASDDNLECLLLDPTWTKTCDAVFPMLTNEQRRVVAEWLLYTAANVAYAAVRDQHVAKVRKSRWGNFLAG